MKLEPIELFANVVLTTIQGMDAAPFKCAKDPSGSITLSKEMAEELAKEALAYKQFFKCSNELARIIDTKTSGIYVAPVVFQWASDQYVTARDKCREFQPKSLEIGSR